MKILCVTDFAVRPPDRDVYKRQHLLFLTNFYPPAELGGWEQWCQEIADEFIARGHRLTILTSRFRRDQVAMLEPHVHRRLHLESDLNHYRPIEFFTELRQRDAFNRKTLIKLVDSEQPDVIVIWGMWQLNHQLAVLAEELRPNRVAYYFCGFWPCLLYTSPSPRDS